MNVNTNYQPSELESVRLTDISNNSPRSTETPSKASGLLGSFFALFSFSSKEASQQQSAQKKTWTQSISDFFSGLFSNSSKESKTSLSGAKISWADRANNQANANTTQFQQNVRNASLPNNGADKVQSARKTYSEFSTSPNAPQNKTNTALGNELDAVNTNNETALNANKDYQDNGGVTGFMRSMIGNTTGGVDREKTQSPNRNSDIGRESLFVGQKTPSATTKESLNQTNQNLQQRGKKLTATAQQTEQLKNAASDWAAGAKQLKEKLAQQNKSWW